MAKTANAVSPANAAVGRTCVAANGVSLRHCPPARSLATHSRVSSIGRIIGATAILTAIAKPTIAPSRMASRLRRVSISRSIAQSDARDASTVNGSGR